MIGLKPFTHTAIINSREKTQNPVYRDNLVGTIYFDVEEYRPYITNKLTFETGDYIVQSVKPLSTMTQKRLAAFVLLKDPDDTLLPSITREIAQQIRNADIYASEKSEAQLKGRSADVVWCYFGYSEEDLARGNHFAYTIWTDDEEMRKRYFRDGRNSEVLDGIYVFWNTSYEKYILKIRGNRIARNVMIHKLQDMLPARTQAYSL